MLPFAKFTKTAPFGAVFLRGVPKYVRLKAMKHFALFTLLIALALPVSAFAGNTQTPNTTSQIPTESSVKGVITTQKPDGLPDKPFDWNSLPPEIRTTKEQLEAEAMEVHTFCSDNGYQKGIYSCECVSGAFLQMREWVGPAPTQSELMTKVYSSANPNCANITLISDNVMRNCMAGRKVFNEMATDTEEYCVCVAQKVAEFYKKQPDPQPGYMQAVQMYANTECSDPTKRPVKATPKTEDPLGFKIPQKQ